MRLTVTKLLNKRIGAPSVNAQKGTPLEKGDEIDVVEQVKGDSYDGNNLWYKDAGNNFYWSGGVSNNVRKRSLLNKEINYNLLIKNISEEIKKTKGEGVKIAIIDSGIDIDHPDFVDLFLPSDNFCQDYTDSVIGYRDQVGHGTHIAGIISARNTTNDGVIGVAPKSSIFNVKVSSDNGSLLVTNIDKALEFIIKK